MASQEHKSQSVLTRRRFIKNAIVSGVALAAGGILKLINTPLDILGTNKTVDVRASGPYYFGTDNTEKSVKPETPQDFYIGLLGNGINPYNGVFKTDAATLATKNHTHVFWGLKGPLHYGRGGNSPYEWGRQQAIVAKNYRHNSMFYSFIGGQTLFADIEPGDPNDPDKFDGWENPLNSYYPEQAIQNNRDVLEGWMSVITHYGYYGSLMPGIYSQLQFLTLWFGTNYRVPYPYVLWVCKLANQHGLYGDPAKDTCEPVDPTCLTCAPYDTTCNGTAEQITRQYEQYRLSDSYGGFRQVIWQYWTDNNISTQDGNELDDFGNYTYSFLPIPNHPTYIPVIKKPDYVPQNFPDTISSSYPAPASSSSALETTINTPETDAYPPP